MLGVSLSGVIGRYLYAQIPRQVATAELSLKIFHQVLERQTVVPQAQLYGLLHLPAPNQISRRSPFAALCYMMFSDLARPFRIARLRLRVVGKRTIIRSLGGLSQPKNEK